MIMPKQHGNADSEIKPTEKREEEGYKKIHIKLSYWHTICFLIIRIY
jgi:hypothetical protein